MIKSRPITRVLTRVWTLTVLLFGSMLYAYGDLDNPATEGTFYWLYKDILVILIGGLIIVLAGKERIPKESFVWLVFYFLLATYVFIYFAVLGEGVAHTYLKIFKNGFIYIGFSVLISSYVLKVEGTDYLIKVVLESLLIAFVVSVLLFWFSPIQSNTGRLFGTFGSPNSAGFAAGFAIALVFVSKNFIGSWRVRERLALLLAFTVLALSASIGSIIGVLFFAYAMFVGKSPSVLRSAVATFLVLFAILFSSLCSYFIWLRNPSALEAEVYARIISIVSQGAENDSIAIRLKDYLISLSMSCDDSRILPSIFGCLPSDDFRRFDSALFSVVFNFGYIVAFIFLFLAFYPVFFTLINKKNKNAVHQKTGTELYKYQHIQPLIYFMITFVPINFILQHSFDVFPTNFMYAILFSIFYASTSRNLSYKRSNS